MQVLTKQTLSGRRSGDLDDVRREIEVLKSLRHRNIVSLREVCPKF